MPDHPRPHLIEGGRHEDARGIVSFVNEFDFCGVDRFYTIRSHQAGQARGWVGHRRDQKWFSVVQGTILIGVVQPDDWKKPSLDLAVDRFELSAEKPAVLSVPAGFATASVSLSDDAMLVVFSSGRIEDAKSDDYRFELDMWGLKAL